MDEEVSEVDSFFTEAEVEECCRGTSVWICPVCHKRLSRKQTLKAHLYSVHSARAGSTSKRYKLYDYCPTARIPRSTQSRWNLKEKEVEHEKDGGENETIMAPTSSHSIDGCDHALISSQGAAISSCEDKEEDQPNQNVSGYNVSKVIPTSTSYQDISGSSAAAVSQEQLEGNLFEESISLVDDSVSNSYYADAAGDNFLLVDMDCSDDCSDAESSSDESAVSSEEETYLNENSLQGPPLYVFPPSDTLQRSPISHQQHMLLLCAYAISQKLSGVAFQQLLDVVKLHLPENSICEGNVLELKEKLANEEIIFHDICRVCGALYKEDAMMCRTPGCGTRKITDSADRKRVCFATSNCEEQLRNILQRHGNFEKILEEIEKRVTDADNTCICDVSSGSLYRELCEPGNFLDNTNDALNITLTWNTDGIPLFKSSSVSLWPVYLAINELPPKERFLKKNLVVWGIWQGDCKPSMNTFLSPFVKDMMKLHRTGFPVNGKICHAMLLLGSMDLQARAYAMNFVQHNGTSSCLYCEEPGKVVSSGKGHSRCFPYSDEVTMRTKISVCEAASEAVSSGKTTHGFHGKSVLLCLPFFQPQKHIVIDYMHGVLLGINKKLLSLWFDAKFYKEDFFIGNKIEDIDHLLKKIRPPYLINRLPRKLKNNYHRWKASEIRSWFLFYSIPCSQGILPDIYLQHFACLVEGIHLLLMECISPQNLLRVKTLLHAFYKNSTDLYGENFAGLNVHNLWHYADFVKMWGPLWAWSCFGFESCNGEILQSVHGKGNVCTEIFWSLHAEKQIELEMKSMPKGQVKSYFQKVLLGSKRKKPKTAQAYQCEYIPPLQDTVVEEDLLSDMDINRTEMTSPNNYDTCHAKVLKIVRHGFVFYSKACTRVRKRNSYTALLEKSAADGGMAIIIDYFLVNKMTYCVFAIGHTMRVVGPALSRRCFHIQRVEQIQRRISAVPAQLLKEPVVFMAKGQEQFIACFPNFVEMD